MRILITNDDGIDAAGIKKIAKIAVEHNYLSVGTIECSVIRGMQRSGGNGGK